jgi:hypothetical protein
MSKIMVSMLLTLLLTCLAFSGLGEYGLAHSNARVQLILSSVNTCIIIAKVSFAPFPRFAQNLVHIRCEIA